MQTTMIGVVALMLLTACTGSGDDARPVAGGCSQELVVYLDAAANRARQSVVEQLLDEHEDVESLTFNSPQEAYRAFKRTYRDQPEIYKDRSPADFPGSFEVRLTPGTGYSEFEVLLLGTSGIDQVVPGPCTTKEESR